MGNRRMFSKQIIQSTSFLKMPMSSQYLYMQLAVSADDDGIVEAFNIMRLVGGNEDDLKVLEAKGFIKVLNDDLITYIVHWNEHNLIRSDRKKDSIYKNLLVQILPEVTLIESRQRVDRIKKDFGTSQGQPSVNQLSDNGPPKVSKDKLSEVRLSNKNRDLKKSPDENIKNIDFEKIKTDFNNICTDLPNVKTMTTTRKNTLKKWLNDNKDINLIDFFKSVNESDFLSGRKTDWKATFDWIIKPSNRIKILENNYKNNENNFKKVNKPEQATNYDQRKYKDEDWENVFENSHLL